MGRRISYIGYRISYVVACVLEGLRCLVYVKERRNTERRISTVSDEAAIE